MPLCSWRWCVWASWRGPAYGAQRAVDQIDQNLLNYGDPFQNGDIKKNSSLDFYYLVGWEQLIQYSTTKAHGYNPELGGHAPFDMPEEFSATDDKSTTDFLWGATRFLYTVHQTTNTRDLKIFTTGAIEVTYNDDGSLSQVEIASTDGPKVVGSTPGAGQCANQNNGTPTQDLHRVFLMLDGSESGYSADGSLYHAVFYYVVRHADGSITASQSDDQTTIGLLKVEAYWAIEGELALQKTSANTSITSNNSCYSLEGATYGVYNDAACADLETTLETDAEGKAECTLTVGNYWVKEISAPPGYALDTTVYPVEVQAGKTVKVNGGKVSDAPQAHVVVDLATKKDTTSGGQAQGSASLAGAQFTVKYYDNVAGKTSGDPKRTWVFRTGSDGSVAFDAAHLASGDALYIDKGREGATNKLVVPLGTITVQETKAPAGYNLGNGSTPQVKKVVLSGTGTAKVLLAGYEAYEQADTVMRGDYRLVKVGNTGVDDAAPQEPDPVLVAGVQFQIVNRSAQAVVSPRDGTTLVAPGEVVCTITTNEDGFASTRAGKSVNGWATPSGWSGALAYGSYSVHEIIPQSVQDVYYEAYGTTLMAADDWNLTIDSEEQYDPAILVANKIPQTALKIVKVDEESGLSIPLPCSFRLYDGRGELVTYTDHYPETNVMDTWTASESGEVTLPMMLNDGSYTIEEVEAPEGYVLAEEKLTFTVDAAYRSWDDPIVVSFTDKPARGVVSVAKTDEVDASPVVGACYVVQAATDITTPDGTVHAQAGEVVANLETDAEGHAETGELYLGSYDVYETKAPEGYALDHEMRRVELVYEGQDVPVVSTSLELADGRTTIRLLKVDSATGEALPGAKFSVKSEDSTFEQEEQTGEDGTFVLEKLAHGSYTLEEVEAPEGYWVEDADASGGTDADEGASATEIASKRTFRVDDQGYVVLEDGTSAGQIQVQVENAPVTIGTTATCNGQHEVKLTGPVELVDVVAYRGCIPGEEYTVEGTVHFVGTDDKGNPTDEGEVKDGDDKAIVASTTFTAESVEGEVEVVFTFDAELVEDATVVVFEDLRRKGNSIAWHADPSDTEQTVVFHGPDEPKAEEPVPDEPKPEEPTPEKPESAKAVKTGDALVAVLLACLSVGPGSFALARYARRRPRLLLRRRSLKLSGSRILGRSSR